MLLVLKDYLKNWCSGQQDGSVDMAHAAKPDYLSLILGTHMVEIPDCYELFSDLTGAGAHMHAHMHTTVIKDF